MRPAAGPCVAAPDMSGASADPGHVSIRGVRINMIQECVDLGCQNRQVRSTCRRDRHIASTCRLRSRESTSGAPLGRLGAESERGPGIRSPTAAADLIGVRYREASGRLRGRCESKSRLTRSVGPDTPDMPKESPDPRNVSILGAEIDRFGQHVEGIDISLRHVDCGVENRQVVRRWVDLELRAGEVRASGGGELTERFGSCCHEVEG